MGKQYSGLIESLESASAYGLIADSVGRRKKFSPCKKQRYKERTQAERTNGRLRDQFGAANIRVKGYVKVMSHLMFGILALTVDQILRLIT